MHPWGRGEIWKPFGLDHAVGNVHTETVGAAVQPEAQYVAEHRANFLVVPVEVWLRGIEDMQVHLAGGAVFVGGPGPHGSAEHRFPVIGQGSFVGVAEDEAIAFGGAGRGVQCFLEPGVLIGAVVWNKINDDA